MALRKQPAARPAAPLAQPVASDTVMLRCEDLGETRPFEPAHAAALLQLQADRGVSGAATWQLVAPAPSDEQSV